MPSPDYTTTPKYAIRVPLGDTFILDIDAAWLATATDIENKLAGYVSGTHAARLAATNLDGLFWRETDTGTIYLGTGSTWLTVGGPRTTHHTHAFTWDDQTSQNSAGTVVGSKTVYASGESISLLGAFVRCETVGSTPSTFKLQYDHAAHGTFTDIAVAATLQPSGLAAVFIAASSAPLALASGDTFRVVATNPLSGNSKGCEIAPVTEHIA